MTNKEKPKITERNYENVSHLLAYANSLVNEEYAVVKKTKNGKRIYKIWKYFLELGDIENEVKSEFPTAEKGGLEIIAEKESGKKAKNEVTFKGNEEEIKMFIESAGHYVDDLKSDKKNLHLKTKCWSVDEVEEQNLKYLFEELGKEYHKIYME